MAYRRSFLILFVAVISSAQAQQAPMKWAADGNSYYKTEGGEVNLYTLPGNTRSTFLSTADLTPPGRDKALSVRAFYPFGDGSKVLIYTNSRRVWRQDTQGDYWIFDRPAHSLRQIGTARTPSSLRFAKLSPDGSQVAYISENALYLEDLKSSRVTLLTPDAGKRMINGTFDWAYEEEFGTQDGFQWSPDGARIAFWQIDASKIRNYLMLNTTDSVYSRVVPVEYPTVGQNPSPARIGVITVAGGKTTWLDIPGDPQQHYLPRMEWNGNELFVQQLNRKQNESKIFRCSVDGKCQLVYTERDAAWIEVRSMDNVDRLGYRHSFTWLKGGESFLWVSEKDGWRHIYRIDKTGKESLVTNGAYDIVSMKHVDEKSGYVYFIASPQNATQRYLYRAKLDGKGNAEKLSPEGWDGTHNYSISPSGKYSTHSFSNHYTRSMNEIISLPAHQPMIPAESMASKRSQSEEPKTVEFFKVRTDEGVELDGWMVKPKDFNPAKKYPVVFYVYTEPAGQTVTDTYGAGKNRMYKGDMRDDGYIYLSVDNRGTPSPRGAAWRKSIYRKIGKINISDQAAAAKKILEWPFVDAERVAVWGWSGGGSATLNLLFQYPDIYKTGIAIAAVANQLTYDNIYQERYMGIPEENLQDFVDGSPIAYAKNFKGKLLYVHGTGDDNVHYNNAEMLINELVKHGKLFEMMAYPNRTHGISEGEGTTAHLSMTYTEFLKRNCPPGAR